MSGAVHDVVEHLVQRILLRLEGGLAHVHVVPGIRSKFLIQSKGFMDYFLLKRRKFRECCIINKFCHKLKRNLPYSDENFSLT